MSGLRAAAATAEIVADSSMIIGGSVLAGTCASQEAPLRASAILMEADQRVCIVSCDVIGLAKDLMDEAAEGIAEACEMPVENVLISATHTHHAPSTITVHGYERVEEFCRRTVAAAVDAARQANETLRSASDKPNESEAELLYALGQECTIGHNSRWHMQDEQIAWTGHDPSHAIRPSGPHDPDLPVLALRRPGGALAGCLFCHATHNIGTAATEAMVRSPGFLGLAAQQLEDEHRAPFLYVPGAIGSSHRAPGISVGEATLRAQTAVNEAISRARPALIGPMFAIKRPFTCRYREFDEAEAAKAVARWCYRCFDERTSAAYERVFADMRQDMASRAGESFETWLQVLRLGEVAIVGIPGEMFASLGLEIRQRSPIRNTIVVGLANDEVGYLPDRRAYELGGYQTWVGYHSQVEPGTGEAMVEAALALLEETDAGAPPDEATSQRLMARDLPQLQRFYNELSPAARRFFRPLGWNATFADCLGVRHHEANRKRFDLVLKVGDRVIGWGFLSDAQSEVPELGIAVADDWCGKGYGSRLMESLIRRARDQKKQAVSLIHVKENEAAADLYRKHGFEPTGDEHTGDDGEVYRDMGLSLQDEAASE